MRWLYFKTRETDLTYLFHAKDIYCKKKTFIVERKVEKRALERAYASISEGEEKDNKEYFPL